VLDEELDPNLVVDIQNYVEKLLDSGLRSRLISLIKVTPHFQDHPGLCISALSSSSISFL
jgi:hypothetical protein